MRLLFYFFAQLPLVVLQLLGALIGNLLWLIPNDRRTTAITNVRRCFPEMKPAEQRRVARLSLGAEMKTYCETPMIWLGADWRVRRLVAGYRGLEAFTKAYEPKTGMMLLTLHQGCFEAGAIPMSATWPLAGIYKPQKGVVDELSMKGRSRNGGILVPAVGGSVREQMQKLVDDGLGIYIMPDQDPPEGRGVFAPFFGNLAHTPTLVHRLLQKRKVPVILMWAKRLSWGRGFRVYIREASPGIYDADPVASATSMNADFEGFVRDCPEQYWWGYKRFRRQPPGAPPFYPK